MKPIDYKRYKKIQKMSLNELNQWFLSIWESGVQAGRIVDAIMEGKENKG